METQERDSEGVTSARSGESGAEEGHSSGAGFSFTFQKRANARGRRELIGSGGSGADWSGDGEKDFVLSLEGKEIQSTKPRETKKEYVIPMIGANNWRMPSTKGGEGGLVTTEKSIEETTLDKEAAEAIMRDLHEAQLRASEAGDGGAIVPLLMKNKPPTVDGRDDELADVELRPNMSSAEDYESMPIDQFGAAMLKGMGWKKGDPVGKTNKGLVEPIEFIPRLGGLGLGAAASKPRMPKPGWIRKPGESKKQVAGPYVDKDGRVRHFKRVGEEIPDQSLHGFVAGNYAQVLKGPHQGLYGKIVSVDEDNARVLLRLTINKQVVISVEPLNTGPHSHSDCLSERKVVDFSQHSLELVSAEEHRERGRETGEQQFGLLHRKRERRSPGKGDSDVLAQSGGGTTHKDGKSRKEEEMEEEKKEHKRHVSLKRTKYDKGDRDGRHPSLAEGGGKHDRLKRKGRHKTKSGQAKLRSDGSSLRHAQGEEGDEEKNASRLEERPWIAANLKTRLVDRSFQKGKFYNQKVIIIDVINLDTCICQTDGGRLLEGIRQSMLETVVPKATGVVVMVVRGGRKGQVCTLVHRDSSNYKATVEVMHSGDVIQLDYDDICEYVGTTEDMW